MEWINVDDKLPENLQQVLCYKDNEFVIRIYNEGDWFNEYLASTMNYKQEIEPIGFWRYLPEPPK